MGFLQFDLLKSLQTRLVCQKKQHLAFQRFQKENDMCDKKRGITLIETLLSIMIVIIIVSLIAVAVQSARAAAARVQCANNLRQLGLATHHYASQFNVLPLTGKGVISLHGHLLPYLELKPIHNSINFQLGFVVEADPSNLTVNNVKISGFVCPSDMDVEWATCGYPGNAGTGFQKFGFNGIFSTPGKPPVGYKNITDGITNTAAFSEWVIGPASHQNDDLRRFVFSTPSPPLLEPSNFDKFINACKLMNASAPQSDPVGKGRSWLRGDFKHTLYNHAMAINEQSCTNAGFVPHGAWTAGSLHSQGANVAFADGRVQFVKSSVPLAIWRSLGSRNGGEAISDDSF